MKTKTYKILWIKNVHWPFASGTMSMLKPLLLAKKFNAHFVYSTNKHEAYSAYNNIIGNYYKNLNDPLPDKILQYLIEHPLEFVTHRRSYAQLANLIVDEDNNVTSCELEKIKIMDHREYLSSLTSNDINTQELKHRLEPADQITEIIDNMKFIQQVNNLNGNYISVHIRWTDKTDGPCLESSRVELDDYFQACVSVRDKTGINNIVLNCDNKTAVDQMNIKNIEQKYGFSILFDQEENLLEDDWRNSMYQRWSNRKKHFIDNPASVLELQQDHINARKIYKTIIDSNVAIGCAVNSLFRLPYILRNNSNDIDLTNILPYIENVGYRQALWNNCYNGNWQTRKEYQKKFGWPGTTQINDTKK